MGTAVQGERCGVVASRVLQIGNPVRIPRTRLGEIRGNCHRGRSHCQAYRPVGLCFSIGGPRGLHPSSNLASTRNTGAVLVYPNCFPASSFRATRTASACSASLCFNHRHAVIRMRQRRENLHGSSHFQGEYSIRPYHPFRVSESHSPTGYCTRLGNTAESAGAVKVPRQESHHRR